MAGKIINKQSGMSLVELMIALVIGLLLSAALITIYVSNKKVFWDAESAAILQENNRFVLKLIVNDMRMAGFYGQVDYRFIDNKTTGFASGLCKRGETYDDVTEEFSGGGGTEYEYSVPVWAVEAGEQIPSCLSDLDVDPNTDILFVKHARKIPLDSGVPASANKTYIITGYLPEGGNVFAEHVDGTGDTSLETKLSTGGEFENGLIWEYVYHVYYVYKPEGSVYSQLKRIKLEKDSWSEPETVAEGVEDLHFIFGVHDSSVTNTGMVTRYYSASEVSTAGKWQDVVSATIYLRGRSTMSDVSYYDEKTYSYGKRADFTPSGTEARYHRKLLETTEVFYNNQFEQNRR
ncbi:MAG: prepilin-type N-terminal cleavage/methylation domain-containing protein [Gammaproteobacteria bacterium]|nr:MAG: prepilin-type N-terminal cleavage/methylation domain-containing protein [Gammaproteobacteria bacterium]